MKRFQPLAAILALILVLASCGSGNAEEQNKYLVPGKVNMIDLGAGKCIPCKMMAPILKQVKAEYEGKAAITFLDVWEDQTPAKVFDIRVIPTQIFFDKNGKEVLRHEGFMDKKTIKAQLAQMGVK